MVLKAQQRMIRGWRCGWEFAIGKANSVQPELKRYGVEGEEIALPIAPS